MDVINTLIKQSNNCFLCFKEDWKSINVNEVIEIHNLSSEYRLTLHDIVRDFFPFYEIISSQACNTCTDLLLKVYLVFKNGIEKLKMAAKFIHRIFEEIDENSNLKTNKEKLYINFVREKDLVVSKEDVIKNESCNLEESKELVSNENSAINCTKSNQAVICEICSKKCKSPEILLKHLKIHNKIPCPYCKKTLKNNYHYKIHLKKHKQPKKWNYPTIKCKQCKYTTTREVDLKSHINKYHLKIKPFICKLCLKGFYSKRNLTEHVSTHYSTKNLICEICGEHFSYKKTLEQHLTLHSGHRPYKCDLCGKTFVTNSRKNEHIKKKHSGQLFPCNFCSKKFSLQKDLNRHCKISHNGV